MKSSVALTVAVLALLLGPATNAHGALTKRTIEVEVNPQDVRGEIQSRRAACEKEQFVGLYRKEDEVLFESAFTNRRGKFEYQLAHPSGKYFVRTGKEETRRCEGARSDTFEISENRNGREPFAF